jgi:GNAT superfamily N-acetyltransferase
LTSSDAIVAGHERRLAALDPLLRTAHPLPAPEPGDLTLRTPGAVAVLRRQRPDPASFLASWGAADQHRLTARVAGPDPAGAMGGLLDECRDRVLPQVIPHAPDTEVNITWPTRDPVMTRQFLAHGLVPAAAIAARPAGRGTPEVPTSAGVRPFAAGDVDAATDLWLQEVRWDAQFDSAVERPSTAGAIRRELLGVLAHDPAWAWVAEADGRARALLVLSPPERAEWIAKLASPAPVAYLACLVVDAGRRGDGFGAALVRQAHASLDAAGVAVTLLHYAALNPLSAPFWHRCGYRPLWTIWHARPASRLRAEVTA